MSPHMRWLLLGHCWHIKPNTVTTGAYICALCFGHEGEHRYVHFSRFTSPRNETIRLV